MKTVLCSQCGKKFQVYHERNINGYSDCRTHIRGFFKRNPEFFTKQINDYSEYFTEEEIKDMKGVA